MESRAFHRLLENVRDRLESIRSPDERAVAFRRDLVRRGALLLAAVLAVVAIGAAGYSVGASQVSDADTAYESGADAGEQRGTAVGSRRGYRSAFRRARERAFDAAYVDAYRTAYREAFESADFAAPSRVKVSGP
jgi:hypothetical protein